MMQQRKIGARAEYRLREGQRVKESVSVAEKFPQLKTLTVMLACFDSEGLTKASEIKYTVNLNYARSVFCIDCANGECVGGDFDLSGELERAIGAGEGTAAGELRCQGWRNKATIDSIPCHSILRYTLSLGY